MNATYAEMFQRYGDMVLRLAITKTGNRADGEDLLQEVFTRLVKYHPDFKSEEHKKAWLLKATANCSASFRNSAWKKRHLPSDSPELLAGKVSAGSQEADLDRSETVRNAVLSLPENYRTAVHLFYYEELSTAGIAEAMGMSEGAVRTILSRARDKLRKTLGEEI